MRDCEGISKPAELEQLEAMIAVVILAAGESRRMGRPKALLPFPESFAAAPAETKRTEKIEATTFLRHLMEVTRHPSAVALRVVAGAHAEEIRAAAKLDANELVVNGEWQRGQLSSLQAAIRSLAKSPTDGVLVCPVDHPLISAALVARLMEAFELNKNKIVIPTYRGRRGHPVIFPAALYEELLSAPQEIGARAVVRAHASGVMEIPVEEEGVILNLNEPESLKNLESRRGSWSRTT